MLTGADRYYALDIVGYADVETNLAVLAALVELFEARAPVPEGEYGATPILESSDFPRAVLTDDRLAATMSPERVSAIRTAVENLGHEHDGICLGYAPSWLDDEPPQESADMIFSEAVLEHVDDLATMYRRLYEWLSPDGLMSHEIDFTSHDFARTWDGHWTLSDRAWTMVRGKRRFAINRQPLSTHLRFLEEAGFRVVHVHRVPAPSEIRRDQLAPRFANLSDDDLATCSAIVHAVKN